MRGALFVSLLSVQIAGMPLALPALAAAPEPNEREQAMLKLYQQPNSAIIPLLKNAPEVVDGQTLHPKIQHYQEQRGRTTEGKAANDSYMAKIDTPEGARFVRLAVDRTWNFRTKVTEEMAQVEDRQVPGRGGPIDVRIYRPKTEQQGPLPVLVYYHGGGWVFGSIDAADRAVRLIANEAKLIVVSVNYRLYPDAGYPAQQDDAQDAFRWVVKNAASFGGDPKLIATGGDSAGGQLTMSVSMRQQKANEPMPVYQILYYPVTDVQMNTRSYKLFGEGFGLSREFMNIVYTRLYPTETLRANPDISPLRAKSLKGLPATIVVTSGFDVLRDEGRALALKLQKDGVSTTYLNYPSLTHGFMQHSGTIDDAETACVQTARLLGTALRSRAPLLAQQG
jgi:acetyl esterase